MKKLKVMLGVITCVLTMTACGSAGTPARIDGTELDPQSAQSLISSAEEVVGYLQQIESAGAEAQYEKDAIFKPAIDSWESSSKDIGEVLGFMDEYAVETKEGNITVSIGVDGSDHDADVVIVAAQNGQQLATKSITTNVRYSFGELMKQAGLNTLLGMGTTFVVLIILMALISLFKFIPKIQAAFSKKPAVEAKAAPAPAAAPAPVVEDATDDNELVAVIAAAIAASEGAATTDGFVVRSIRKARKKGF